MSDIQSNTVIDQRRFQIASLLLGFGLFNILFGGLLGWEGVGLSKAVAGGVFTFLGGIYVLVALTPVFAQWAGYESVSRLDDLDWGTQIAVIAVYFWGVLAVIFVLLGVIP